MSLCYIPCINGIMGGGGGVKESRKTRVTDEFFSQLKDIFSSVTLHMKVQHCHLYASIL